MTMDTPRIEPMPASAVAELRASDFAHLDEGGHRYFDYTGSGVAPRRVVEGIHDLWSSTVLGNPHSDNPTSAPATELVERARRRVLEFFGASEHECVFTANASAALKLVGEAFPFSEQRPLLLSADNHNSVNGIREFARRRGATPRTVPLVTPSLELDRSALDGLLADSGSGGGLFAFPAQSNYSGVQHPLELVGRAREHGWRVLLDTAAFAPSNPVDLDAMGADFACISFYKMFGLPTGVGALIARSDALAELQRPWFAGGTISMVSVAADDHVLTPGHSGFEDGTANFASIPAVTHGLDLLGDLRMEAVHAHVAAATERLLGAFGQLRHSNGRPMVGVIGGAEGVARGGTVTFDLLDPGGAMVHDRAVVERAAASGISLRWGCFCNPGCGEAARGLDAGEMASYFQRVEPPGFCDLDDDLWLRRGRGASALRASVGIATNAEDISALVALVESFRDCSADAIGRPGAAPRGLPDAP
ncbi:MAG: aminotransferase class V-fold PLP-dependent enzyme [Microthrixaceae bacterium]|nr:aminotransferase class V-fold PLP-dependent enzyme [Microthrixaceae bacterium]